MKHQIVRMSILETLDGLIDWLGSGKFNIAEIRNRLTNIRQEIEAMEATNAKLKNDYLYLKNTTEDEISRLDEENAKLVLSNGGMKENPKPAKYSIEPDAEKILKVLFESKESVTAEQISRILKIKTSMARYHFGELEGQGLIRQLTAFGGFEIVKEGRVYVTKNGLA